MFLLVALCTLVVLPLCNVMAMALASLGVARAAGVDGGKLLFKHAPREAFDARSRLAFWATVAAGPIASYLCVISLIFVGVLLSGRPEYDATVDVRPGGRADAAGMRSGDKLVEIDGKPIVKFEEIKPALAGRSETRLPFVVERDGERRTIEIVTDRDAKVQIAAQSPKQVPVSAGEAIGTALRGSVLPYKSLFSSFKSSEMTIGGPVELVKAATPSAGSPTGGMLVTLGMINSFYWPLSLVIAYGTRPRRKVKPAALPSAA